MAGSIAAEHVDSSLTLLVVLLVIDFASQKDLYLHLVGKMRVAVASPASQCIQDMAGSTRLLGRGFEYKNFYPEKLAAEYEDNRHQSRLCCTFTTRSGILH